MLSDDMAPGPDELYDGTEMRAALARVWAIVPDRYSSGSRGARWPNRKEARVIVLLYGLDGLGYCTRGQLAEELGVSYTRIYQLEQSALRRLKRCPAMSGLLSR